MSCPSVGCNVGGEKDEGDVGVVGCMCDCVAGVEVSDSCCIVGVGCMLSDGRDVELDGCSDFGRFSGSELS